MTATGAPDPLKLTGQSGLFVQHFSSWLRLGYQAYNDNSSNSDPIPKSWQFTFFNDPYTDPNLIMLMSLESSYKSIREKYKKPNIELLRIRWNTRFDFSDTSDASIGNLASWQQMLYFFDGPGQYSSFDAYMYQMLGFSAQTGTTRQLPPISQRPGQLLICRLVAEVGKFNNTTDGYAVNTSRPTAVECDFTDGAGHGLILDNNYITVVGVSRMSNDVSKTSSDALNDQWVQIFYRIHYEELLEETIKDLQARQANRPQVVLSTGGVQATPPTEKDFDEREKERKMKELIHKIMKQKPR